jgi:plastocyanin
MTKKLVGWFVAAVFCTGIAAATAQPPPAIVTIANFSFSPATIEVPVGTTVEWINTDDAPHVVAGADADSPLRSPALDTDDRYTMTFNRPGRYRYFCSLHPQMVGTIVVK